MMRPSVVVISMSMLAACGGLAYLHSSREQAVDEAASVSKSSGTDATAETSVGATPSANSAGASKDATTEATTPNAGEMTASNQTAATPETIAQWIKDTESTDAEARAAAIAALANAPKAQALPALKRVLETGEPNVDRQVALHSLYTLALRDGDNTGQIRDVIRHPIYHGDEDGVTQSAQSLLDDIEAEFTQRAQDAK